MKKLFLIFCLFSKLATADTITHISGYYGANNDGGIALTATMAEGWQFDFVAYLTSPMHGHSVASCTFALVQCDPGDTLNAGFYGSGGSLGSFGHVVDGHIDVVGLFTLPINVHTGDVFTFTVPLTWTSDIKVCANSTDCGAGWTPGTFLYGSGVGYATFSLQVIAPYPNFPDVRTFKIMQGGEINLDSTVPEPTSLVLLLSGVVAAGGRLFGHRSQKSLS